MEDFVVIIKYAAIVISSFYTYGNIAQSVTISKLRKIIYILFAVVAVVAVRIYFPYMTVISLVFILTVFYNSVCEKGNKNNISLAAVSVAISFIMHALGILVAIPLTSVEYMLLGRLSLVVISDAVLALTMSAVQILLCFLLFKLKRLIKGLSMIVGQLSGDVGLFVSCVVIFIASLFFKDDGRKTTVYTIIILAVCLLGFIAYLWWCKRITNNYLNKVQQRNLDMAEQTIAKQKEEIEYLSKIVHKDNKLIGALELSLKEAEGVDRDKLSAMSKERESILHTYKESENMMQKTGVFSVDMMLNYLLKRAFDQNAEFDVVVNGNVKYMVENIINEDDLSTLLADIGENAVIAVSSEERKNILLSIGVRDNSYYIDVYDSGAPFDVNVIENYGRTRYTTHKTTGGSGIGLMQTKELLSKYKASFEIEEIENNSLYTKRVSVVFDSLSQTRIFTNRQEILELRTQRDDIIFSEITVNK